MPATPRHLLVELAAQHDQLRERIARCEALADRLDAGQVEPAQLLDEVTALRRAFDVHNQLEEQLLHPVLLDADWLGEVRVARMVEDHVEEHRAMRYELAAPSSGELRRVLASLRAHLASEERYFLTKQISRADRAG